MKVFNEHVLLFNGYNINEDLQLVFRSLWKDPMSRSLFIDVNTPILWPIKYLQMMLTFQLILPCSNDKKKNLKLRTIMSPRWVY